MAEASIDASLGSQENNEESPNGDAGYVFSSVNSVSEEVSIHLSPRTSSNDLKATRTGMKHAANQQESSVVRGKPLAHGTGGAALSRRPSITAAKIKLTLGDKQERGVKIPVVGHTLGKRKCDMCDEETLMRARCLTCQSSMCGACVDHHRKMKISSDHELQTWEKYHRKVAHSPPTTVPASKQRCKTHLDEKLQFYCKACFLPLCVNCKLTKHEGHKTRDLFEEICEQRENLPFKLSQLRVSFLPLLKQQEKELEDNKRQTNYSVKTAVENIEKRAKFMKDEIDRTSTKVAERLKQKESRETSKLDNLRKTITGIIRSATTTLTIGQRIIQSGDDFEVMEIYQNLLQMMKQITELTKRKGGKTRYMFQDGQMSQQHLQAMFGNFGEKSSRVEKVKSVISKKSRSSSSSIPILQIVPEVQARLLKTFTCKMIPGNKISAIAPINDREAWLCFGWTTNEIYLYNKDGFRRNKLIFKHPVDDIAVDHDGNLIVSTFAGSIVRFVDRNLNIRDFFQCPLRCRGLDVSTAGEIMICGVDTCTAIPPPAKSTIFKYTKKGNKTGHLDGDKSKRIPIHPYRIAENIDGSLAVSDWVNDKEGRVVIFGHDGKLRMIYYGNNNDERNFLPYGICTDKYGHILVSDIAKQEVHLLDIKGHFLRTLLTRDDLDNERPYSLAIDSMGTLWVGNERAQIKIFRYLLNQSHIV